MYRIIIVLNISDTVFGCSCWPRKKIIKTHEKKLHEIDLKILKFFLT